MIGVTGTDGKTTTCNLIYSILEAAGERAGLVTSINAVIGGEAYDTGFHVTSPDPFDLQRFLGQMVAAGCEYVVLEVTSHALDQHRVSGIKFKVAVVTNVTHEHLDYHGTLKNYLEAKAKLFKGVEVAVLNRDDESYGCIKLKSKNQNTKFVTYGIKNEADFTPQTFKFETPLPGEYNRYNCLAAIAATSALSISRERIREAISSFKGIKGRFEEIDEGQDFKVIIDFAHTPNALEQVLKLGSKLKAQRAKLIVVFGCAGLRDYRKRPLMGEIAAKFADIIVLTAEDSRTEDAKEIIEQIAVGCVRAGAEERSKIKGQKSKVKDNRGGKAYFFREPDRRKAIDLAVRLARQGDWVLITGKGHEKSMCFGTREYPWSDQEAARKTLRALKSKG